MAYADQSGASTTRSIRQLSRLRAPADDTLPRYLASYSTTATADFVATMAKASRVFAPYDAAYAERLLGAAQASYAFLQANRTTSPPPFSLARRQLSIDRRRRPAVGNRRTVGDDRRSSALADFEARATPPTLLADFDWQNLQDSVSSLICCPRAKAVIRRW